MSLLRNRITAVVAGSVLVVGLGATGAAAGDLIGSRDIQDGAVGGVDLSAGVNARLHNKATDSQVNGVKEELAGYQSQLAAYESQMAAYESQMGALEDRVAALEGAAATGADINTNWEPGLGATIVDANTTVLDSRNDDGYSFSSIKNLDLEVEQGAHIQYTYRLADGAAQGWGAPRIVITVDGVRYGTVGNVHPDAGYGHDNGDGTWTVDVAPVKFNDNAESPMPGGHVTRASLVYDYQDKGTVTFTNVVIDGQPISFQ